MFFHLELDREIELQPRFFGPRLAEVLQQKLRSEVGRPAARSAPDAAALPCKYAVQRAQAGVTCRTRARLRSRAHAAGGTASSLR